MTKRSHHSPDELIMVFFGIDPKTYEVRRVSLTRGNVLLMSLPDGSFASQIVPRGGHPVTEIHEAWGLTDVFGVPAMAVNAQVTLVRIEELADKAAAMKAAANPSG